MLNEECIIDSDFELIVRLTESSPLWHKAVRAYRDYTILREEAQSA